MSNLTCIDVDICHRMKLLQTSYSVTLTHISNVKMDTVTKLFLQICLHSHTSWNRFCFIRTKPMSIICRMNICIVTAVMNLGQRSVSANNGSCSVRLEMLKSMLAMFLDNLIARIRSKCRSVESKFWTVKLSQKLRSANIYRWKMLRYVLVYILDNLYQSI